MSLTPRETVRDILKANLRKLKEARSLTQEGLATVMDVSGKSTVSNYLNDDQPSIPDATSLYRLKEKYGVSVDDLLSPNFDPGASFTVTEEPQQENSKFGGVYNLYYLTTSKISAFPTRYSEEACLAFGVLAIVKAPEQKANGPAYTAYACYLSENMEEASQLKHLATEAYNRGDAVALRRLFTQKERFCEGEFELLQRGGYYAVTMTGYAGDPEQESRAVVDKILMMGFNPDSADNTPYPGGAAFSSSLSRGSEKAPCAQIIMVSRGDPENEQQVITKELIDAVQKVTQPEATDRIMERYEVLCDNDSYTKEDKSILLRHQIDLQFREELRKTSFQILYLLKETDKRFENFLKQLEE